jgi:FtsH-binding integral membrane protein
MQFNQNVSPLEVGHVGSLEQTNKVLRNTYMLTALAMVPMAIGAVVGTQMSFAFLATSPIMGAFGFLIAAYALMFGIQANRNSGVGCNVCWPSPTVARWWLTPPWARLRYSAPWRRSARR